MKLTRPQFLAAARFGVLTGLAAMLTAGGGIALVWRAMISENDAFIQQSIGDTARLLSNAVTLEVENWVTLLRQTGELQLRPQARAGAPAPDGAPAATPPAPADAVAAAPAPAVSPSPYLDVNLARAVGSIDADPDLLDVSYWSRPTNQDPPSRGYLALNARSSSRVPELLAKLQSLEYSEKALIEPAFSGHVLVFGQWSIDAKGMATMVVPMGNGIVNEVIVAHVRLERFQRAFRSENLAVAALLDEAGNVLAYPDGRGTTGKGNAVELALFRTLRSGTAGPTQSGQTQFRDETGAEHFGGYHRLTVGQLTVLASIPVAEARAGLDAIRHRAVLFLFLAWLLGFGIGLAWRLKRKPETAPRAVAKAAPAVAAVPAESSAPRALPGQTGLLAVSPAVTEAPTLAVAPAVPAFGTGSTPAPAEAEAAPAPAPAPELPAAEPAFAPARVPVVVMHGSLQELTRLVDALAPDDLVEVVSDILTMASSSVAHFGGKIECYGASQFIATWGLPVSEGNEVWSAIRCALELRRDLAALNESRKVDGRKPVRVSLGVHADSAVAGRVGPSGSVALAVVGQVHGCARALDRLAEMTGVDLLISHPVWTQSEAHFVGEQLGEAKLTPETGLTGYFGVRGYRNAAGEEVLVETAYSRVEKDAVVVAVAGEGPVAVQPAASVTQAKRWFVNNGSQIVGPYTPEQIAGSLYAQELDFDSECWAEGTGNSSQIRSAGIFSGSEDEDATLWVYDGKTIHGPLSRGFFATAVTRGALPPEALVCEGSTVSGWLPLSKSVGSVPATLVAESTPVREPQPQADENAFVLEPVSVNKPLHELTPPASLAPEVPPEAPPEVPAVPEPVAEPVAPRVAEPLPEEAVALDATHPPMGPEDFAEPSVSEPEPAVAVAEKGAGQGVLVKRKPAAPARRPEVTLWDQRRNVAPAPIPGLKTEPVPAEPVAPAPAPEVPAAEAAPAIAITSIEVVTPDPAPAPATAEPQESGRRRGAA